MTLLVDAGSLICSGAAIDLNATEHTMSMNAFWSVPDVPAKSTGSSYNIRLAQGRYTGFSNPTHQITGLYDDTGRAYNNFTSLAENGAYFVTGSMLSGMIMSGGVFALIDEKIITASEFGNGSMVYVVPTAYNVIRTPRSDKGSSGVGYMVEYSISFKEVQV